jgi:site-specific recombinase XerD
MRFWGSRAGEAQNFTEIIDIEPLHVAAYVEQLGQRLDKPSVKQHLTAIRMPFDWLVVGQVVTSNPHCHTSLLRPLLKVIPVAHSAMTSRLRHVS